MDVVIRLLLRFILVPLGYVVALWVAMAVVVVAQRSALTAPLQAQYDYFIPPLAFAGPQLAYILAPAAIFVLISEAFAIRSWIFYTATGGLSALIGWVLTQDIRYEYRFLTEPRILIAAGLVAGLSYWIVSGWTAGFWKPIRSPRRLTPPS
jgi:hypothetical protein